MLKIFEVLVVICWTDFKTHLWVELCLLRRAQGVPIIPTTAAWNLIQIRWDKDKDKFNIAINLNITLLGVDGKVDGKVDWAVENEEEVGHRGKKVDQVCLQIFDSVSWSCLWWTIKMMMGMKMMIARSWIKSVSKFFTPFPEVDYDEQWCTIKMMTRMMTRMRMRVLSRPPDLWLNSLKSAL